MKTPALQQFSKMKHVCVAALVVITSITPSRAIWPEKNPADVVRSFYSWYVHEVTNGSRPLEKQRGQMRRFVTDRLLNRIDTMPKGPSALNADFFLNAQAVDPESGKNLGVRTNQSGR